ncbi:uncharacterized protein LOC131172176 [Hevea brasiliensis]|uniref:uncharacterized protein LOC131172176 n=1 Tax=Hevea brasiliensis TaxID=3981 RepID=UPI0026004B4F|nr:uncharacterized protein LOC131172176 [Hevea brasiliensis]
MDQLATHNKMLENQIAQQVSSLSKTAEALSQMPSYAKFLKDILSKKRRLEDYETIALIEECSAILQNKLPPKLKDPGSFSIPCLISNMNIDKALYDLGAKNIPIKVGKFFIPVDFIVLEMEEDVQIPIILERLFLATAGAVIDVKNGQLTLKQVEEEFIKAQPEDPLGVSIMHNHIAEKENTEIIACAQSLTGNPPLLLAQVFTIEELKEEQPKGKVQDNTKQVELKPLPFTLRYAFLDSNFEYPVIIDASLS